MDPEGGKHKTPGFPGVLCRSDAGCSAYFIRIIFFTELKLPVWMR